jgi:hypothetical protein
MSYYEELGAKRASGDPSEEDVDVDYPEEESRTFEGNTYADEPRLGRATGNTDNSSHQVYGPAAQSRPYAEESQTHQAKPPVPNRGNRGALRHLQGVRKPVSQSHADSEELDDNRAYDTVKHERQLDALIGNPSRKQPPSRPAESAEPSFDFQGFDGFDSSSAQPQSHTGSRNSRQL